MPQQTRYEDPALGKLFISGYDANSLANPVLELHIDANNPAMTVVPGQSLKVFPAALGVPVDVSDKYPSHILTHVEPYHADQRQKLTYRIVPTPWIYEISFAAQSETFVFVKHRQNIAANIKPSLIQTNGAGCSVVLTFNGGQVTGGSFAGGSDFPDLFGVIIQSPAGSAPLVTATAYGTATNGVPDSNATNKGFILTNGGRGYAGSETAAVVGDSLVEVDRMDTDSFLSIEKVSIMQMTWEEQTSIAIREPEIFIVGSDGVFFDTIDGIGSAYFPYRNARTRTLPASVLHWLSIGETRLPLPASKLVLKNGKTVINSDLYGTGINVNLWNPGLIGARLYLNLLFAEVFTDPGSYSGSWNNISFGPITFGPSIPSATQYLAEVSAGCYALKNFESVPLKGQIFSNVAVCFPLD